MSYDLFLARRDRLGIAPQEFHAFFQSRPNWSVKDTQAWYTNEDTGVYFSVDFGPEELVDDEEADDVPPDEKFDRVASFTINYFRPHFFGLEAAPELASFVSEFDLIVDDPQMGGMGRGEFSVDGFLSGWNTGNEFGYRAIVGQHANESFHALPTSDLERYWVWNNSRQALQRSVGESAFVPRVVFHVMDGSVLSGVVWGDAIPSLVPIVDTVLIPRQEHAPRRFFRRAQDLVCLRWEEVAELLNEYTLHPDPIPHHRVLYSTAPEKLVRFVRGQSAFEPRLVGVPTDKLLNAELIESARKNGLAAQ